MVGCCPLALALDRQVLSYPSGEPFPTTALRLTIAAHINEMGNLGQVRLEPYRSDGERDWVRSCRLGSPRWRNRFGAMVQSDPILVNRMPVRTL